MSPPGLSLAGLAVALGVGLLIGVERERRKGEGPTRAAAGLRTFAVASLLGAVAFAVGGAVLLATALIGVIALAVFSYWRTRDEDPGITTESALVLTTLLGALAMSDAMLAGGLGVLVAGLLYARSPLHGFVRSVLSEEDVRDALILAGASLIVLPLLPDRAMGPYGALNPHTLWLIVILIMVVSAVGYVAIRVAGARFGLPVAGLASGFISSTATIAAMGERAGRSPPVFASAVAGAVLSTVATVIQMAVLLPAISLPALRAMVLPLLFAGIAASAYGLFFTLRVLRRDIGDQYRPGRALSLQKALLFAAILAVILVASAALRERFGEAGTVVVVAIAGFVDTHSAAASVAALTASGRLAPADAVVPILMALSTNTVSKIVFAVAAGSRNFALAVVPGLILVVLAAWLGAAAASLVP